MNGSRRMMVVGEKRVKYWCALGALALAAAVGCNGDVGAGPVETVDAAEVAETVIDMPVEQQPLAVEEIARDAVAVRARRSEAEKQTYRQSVTSLRELLTSDAETEIRAHAALGLGQARDVDAMPILLATMEDEAADAELRRNAAWAASQITGFIVTFNPQGSNQENAAALNEYRKFYSESNEFVEMLRDPEKLRAVEDRVREEKRRKYGAGE